MARKQTILMFEIGSQKAADKIQRFAHLINLPTVEVRWMEETGLYRVTLMGKMDYFPTPNTVMVHLCEVSRVYTKPSQF